MTSCYILIVKLIETLKELKFKDISHLPFQFQKWVVLYRVYMFKF